MFWFIGRAFAEQWSTFRTTPLAAQPRWGFVVLSAAIMLGAFVVLIETWRRIIHAWGEPLGFDDAARIWFVSNLVRYLPGSTVVQLGAMAELSRRRRISPLAATGASLINVAVNIGTGIVVALVAGRDAVDTLSHGRARIGIAIAVLVFAGVLALPYLLPRMIGAVRSVTGRALPIGRLPMRAVLVSVAGNLVAWVLYGLSYRALIAGIVGGAPHPAMEYIAVYAAAYVVGYLVFAVPAGVGVREGVQLEALTVLGMANHPQAIVIAAAARLVSMLLEIIPGLILLSRGTRAPTSRPE